jgi:hypothetical protein
MFHGISAALTRLVRRIADRQTLCFEYAAWHGWETRRIGRSTYRFRDPRFGQLAATRTANAPEGRTWAQAAAAERIRALGPVTPLEHHTSSTARRRS